jgi:hypothetical protein
MKFSKPSFRQHRDFLAAESWHGLPPWAIPDDWQTGCENSLLNAPIKVTVLLLLSFDGTGCKAGYNLPFGEHVENDCR